MRASLRATACLAALLFSLSGQAVIEVRQFEDPEKQQLYDELIDELRCLVCQNQNLAASNAELAKDLRAQTYEMIQAGAGKQEIRDYMVARYGDFVLYRPPVKSTTALLWVGPVVLLIAGVVIVVVVARRRSATAELDDDERRKVRELLGD